jgi:glutamyl-tRNA synthetase
MVSRGRFAPTPSGELHIGNAMTALIAWLQIRHTGGTFVLRMEDLDKPRCRPEYARQIIDDLKWLGIDWDEGPDAGGPYSPYSQSERNELYENAFKRLESEGRLYPCFCNRKELRTMARAPHGLTSVGWVCPGNCRDLTHEQRMEKSARKTPSYRFALPDRPVSFTDLAAGEKVFSSGTGGDFVVKRADGFTAYQLAVVVDDAAMGITDVLRGLDLLDSTPWQILLYEALGLPVPRFIHLPLLYGSDGKPLSKRHGSSVTLNRLRKSGVKPEQLVGYLAFLCGLLSRPEPLKALELIREFDLNRLHKEEIILKNFIEKDDEDVTAIEDFGL